MLTESIVASLCFYATAVQTALRLQTEGKSSLHHELKLKRRRQREHSRSARSSCSSQSSQSDDSNYQETEKTEKGKERQDLEIESIIQVRKLVRSRLILMQKQVCLRFSCIKSQHARELEIRRREQEEKERKKQKEVQLDLERQLKEAEMVGEMAFIDI